MKVLILIRHAKSSWDGAVISDFDRPLNGRGKKDAPEMARRLFKRKIRIDQFISSPAKRAKQTAIFFIKEFDRKEDEILLIPSLYDANALAFHDVISVLNNAWDNVAIFSHNPGITEFANNLTSTHIDNMPTAAIFGVKIDIDKWSAFNDAPKNLLFFDYPKSD